MEKLKTFKATDFEDKAPQLSDEKKQEISLLIDKAFRKATGNGVSKDGIEEDIYQYEEWNIYEGDLVIEGNFHSDLPLIITGNFTVKGSYTDGASYGGVMVLGDFSVKEHIISEYSMFVAGNTSASGLICLHYNDYRCTFLGDIVCDILFVHDRAFEMWGDENIEAKLYYNREDKTKGDRRYIQKLKDEFLDELDDEEWDDEYVEIYLDICKLEKFILEGKSIYK